MPRRLPLGSLRIRPSLAVGSGRAWAYRRSSWRLDSEPPAGPPYPPTHAHLATTSKHTLQSSCTVSSLTRWTRTPFHLAPPNLPSLRQSHACISDPGPLVPFPPKYYNRFCIPTCALIPALSSFPSGYIHGS